MHLTGIWSGVWYLAKLSLYLGKESFSLDILSVDEHGQIMAAVTEPAPSQGIRRQNREHTITYPVNGIVCGQCLTLSGMRPGLKPGSYHGIRLKLELDPGNESLFGTYCHKDIPEQKAMVQLKKTALP